MVPRPVQAVLGVAAALGALEALLRPWAGELRPPPRPDVACDSVGAAVIATRQVDEGIARATYTECGARLTGHAEVRDASYVVLLGDSHVAAREVGDAETMGARLAAISRAARRPVNVRQYGWRGASPPQYIVAAPAVLERWNPARVVVVVAEDDLGADVLEGIEPTMSFAEDSSLALAQGPETRGKGSGVREPGARSALFALSRHRWQMILARAPRPVQWLFGPATLDVDPHADDRLIPRIPAEVVRHLRQAYGDRLLIVYLADLHASDTTTAKERLLLEGCARYAAACVTTREAMRAARDSGRAVRGSVTTTIGVGHLNAFGHDLVARRIWSAVAGRDR